MVETVLPPPELPRTSAAMREFDAIDGFITQEMARGELLDNLIDAFTKRANAVMRFQAAFAMETSDRNSYATALLVSPRDPVVRRWVENWRKVNSDG